MACDTSIPRPIDSFIKYFNDIKPYHTKILEIIEQYQFIESMHVEMVEGMDTEITMENNPLCKGVGFGLDFDDECGFDALDCCDLFDCAGGFGLIYDNSDKLIELPIDSIDTELQEIVVSGYHLYDEYINIKSVPNTSTIVLDGDYSNYFSNHKMFWVVRRNTYPIIDQTTNTITITGNHVAQVLAKHNVEIQNTGFNDGHYGVIAADLVSGNTVITLNRELNPTSSLGRILVSSSNKNNGIYQILDYTILGGETHLELSPTTPAALTDVDLGGVHGAVRLRTGLVPMRRAWVGEPTGSLVEDTEWRITHVRIDPFNETTIVTIDGNLSQSYFDPMIKIYGYESGAGFDGVNECSIPKPFNIHTYFNEFLSIEIEEEPPPPVECVDIQLMSFGLYSSEDLSYIPDGFEWGVTTEFTLAGDEGFGILEWDSDNGNYSIVDGNIDCGIIDSEGWTMTFVGGPSVCAIVSHTSCD